VSDHKIGVGYVHIESERGEKKAGQPADGEKPDKSKGIEHGRFEGNGTSIESHRPIKNLNRRRDRDQIAQEREHKPGINGLTADKHMMAPDQKPKNSYRDAGKGDEVVTEDRFAREATDDLADHTHTGKNHDVNGGVRIEPE